MTVGPVVSSEFLHPLKPLAAGVVAAGGSRSGFSCGTMGSGVRLLMLVEVLEGYDVAELGRGDAGSEGVGDIGCEPKEDALDEGQGRLRSWRLDTGFRGNRGRPERNWGLYMHIAPAFLHLRQGKVEMKCPFMLTWSSAAPPGVKMSSGPSVRHRTFCSWHRSQDWRRGIGACPGAGTL